ncbi:lipopolysaccharide transport periplasmic protein LptA [Sulfuricurvum sp.]|uniref:lipopolysaccharide transport periplasmic protein LptA n=1 Tax=Sulfuricurvum sp. TaxID=2025608 RepID=UPI00262C3672|nr:lipopolysaccharide transport periplasmic protein LptA [Sulfuricurvum sp.]MDD2267343.1 lipopolysaccharide transport periplasmic protein LptA [Sulfuricurvum sp.]MDD2784320.1 lipopolysaccharide transport periplasmic protein LptA [Sulfuricurvum sp.]
MIIRTLIILFTLTFITLNAEELKVISDNFKGDQQKGVAVFTGNVKVTKGMDELNASKVTIYTDKDKKPYKYVAEGGVSFFIVTEQQEKYRGKSQSAVYMPNEGEYQFYTKVDLIRLDDFRRVKGDKVVVNMSQGNAVAESAKDEPVIMTFTLQEKNSKQKSTAK